MLLPRAYAAIVIGALALGCSSGPLEPAPRLAPNESLGIDATVRSLSTVEGGCWALDTHRGRYEPMGLPESFRVDGKRVRVVLRDAPNSGSICQIGTLVVIDNISER